jgi:hypothetical protein
MNTNDPQWWERNRAREWDLIDLTCWNKIKVLEPRLKLAEDRFEALQDACNAFEAATETAPTALDDARLDRLGRISGRASNAVDMLAERIKLVEKIQSLHEEETGLIDDNRRTRGLKVRRR